MQYLDYLQGLQRLVPDPAGENRDDGILGKPSMDFCCANIFIWMEEMEEGEQECRKLPTFRVTAAAGLTPCVKKMDSAAVPESPPNAWALHCVISQHDGYRCFRCHCL